MVLAHSLRDHGAKAKLVALVTTETLSAAIINELKVRYTSPTIPSKALTHPIDGLR